jgi:hypothetical protein
MKLISKGGENSQGAVLNILFQIQIRNSNSGYLFILFR